RCGLASLSNIGRAISVPICVIYARGRCVRLYRFTNSARVRGRVELTTRMPFDPHLPIDAALTELPSAVLAHDACVVGEPPAVGKTSRVPLVLLGQPWAAGKKIIVLEPRRLAVRAAAARMAATLGEAIGNTVGYRVRFGSKVSRATRIEVVTEGVFTRM